METNADAWYARWFTWSCRVLDGFFPRSGYLREFRYERGTNLCHFFRTIMLGTLVAAGSLALWAWTAYVAVIMPLSLFPLAGLAMMAGTVLAILVGVVALVVGGLAIAAGVERAPQAWDRIRGRVASTRPPGFTALVWEWVRATKQRFCPTITFRR